MDPLFITIKNIILWFYLNADDHEFRKNRTPYKVWISETILQQTRLKVAVGKINNFLNAFPDLNSLANSEEKEVLEVFKGLGYYNRARNLRKGAQFMAVKYSQIPENYDELLEVPSIGPYTAAAISSICFKKKLLSIDGNVRRIFSRILKIDQNINDRFFDKNLQVLMEPVFRQIPDHPGDLNEALMQFGQKICKTHSPLCNECPISANCQARIMNCVSKFPVMKLKTRKIQVNWKIFIFMFNNCVLLNKYDNFYFLKKHAGFPSILEFDNKKIFSTRSNLLTDYFIDPDNSDFVDAMTHTITKHKISFSYIVINLKSVMLDDPCLFWSPIEGLPDLLISSGLLKVWNHFMIHNLARGGT